MDVRCDRCQTEYELDEMRLTPAGVAVKCTNCGNIFKVKPAAAPEIIPVRPKMREWLVRRQDGSTLTLRELTELQKAVVERQVAPQDSVSLTGESWHELGAMPELASFFDLVRAADRAKAVGGREAVVPQNGHSPGHASNGLGRNPTPMWEDGPKALGSTGAIAPEPAWTVGEKAVDPELAELLEREDLQAVKGGRTGLKVVLVLVVLAAVGAGGYYTYGYWGPMLHGAAPGTISMKSPLPPDVNAPIPPLPADPKPAQASPSEAQKPPEPQPEPPKTAAASPTTVPPAAPAVPSTPGKAAPAPAPPLAAAKAEAAPSATKSPKPAARDDDSAPAGRSFDYYITQGHKLLDSKPAQALTLFQKAAEADPNSPEPDSGRGLAYSNMDRLGDAAAAFQAALKKSPEFTEAIMGLAEISREQGNPKKAMSLYQRYLDLTPDGTDAPVARAQLEQLRGAQEPRSTTVIATPAPAAQPSPAPSAAPEKPVAPPPVVVPDAVPSAVPDHPTP